MFSKGMGRLCRAFSTSFTMSSFAAQNKHYRLFHDLNPPPSPIDQSKLETSAVNHKRVLGIHLLNRKYAKNDGSRPTFTVLISRLA